MDDGEGSTEFLRKADVMACIARETGWLLLQPQSLSAHDLRLAFCLRLHASASRCRYLMLVRHAHSHSHSLCPQTQAQDEWGCDL